MLTWGGNSYYGIEIVKESVVIGSAFGRDDTHMSSVMGLTHCADGERVWVRMRSGLSGNLHGGAWAHFSGTFLHVTN